jgi:hypothetical protein
MATQEKKEIRHLEQGINQTILAQDLFNKPFHFYIPKEIKSEEPVIKAITEIYEKQGWTVEYDVEKSPIGEVFRIFQFTPKIYSQQNERVSSHHGR